jgi:aryl-alcohol dehydrogenase-like predicted oxidoreductase
VLEASRELGVALVAFSPPGRGFLTGALREVDGLKMKDIRRAMSRFQDEAMGAIGHHLTADDNE